jgi:predicted ester cyclase
VRTRLVIAEPPYVAVHLTARGTHRGIFQGIPATGRSWAASCSALYRIEDGRIVDCWENWDLLGILEQLGGVRRPATASA